MEMDKYSDDDVENGCTSTTNFGYESDDIGSGCVDVSASQTNNDPNGKVAIRVEDSDSSDAEANDDDDRAAAGSDKTSSSVGSVNRVKAAFEDCQTKTMTFFGRYSSAIRTTVMVVLVVGYGAYFTYALYYEFSGEPAIRLLWVTMLVALCFALCIVQDHWGDEINKYCLAPIVRFVRRHWMACKWSFICLCIASYVTIIVVDMTNNGHPENIVSFFGMVMFIILMFFYSVDRWHVRWRPVCWGLGLQFVLALIVLRTVAGYEAFKWLGDRIQEFMSYSDAGAMFVFGESYEDHYFAMKVLPVIIYFSAVISVLYYMGVMQVVILKISWLMQVTLGTTAGESVNAAGNIFVGMTEAPLMIKPLIGDMTLSELHAVNVGGYATIAGSVMATYMMIGVPANHLISASVMAAPCALALSKLTYPETEVSKSTSNDVAKLGKSQEKNIMEAASTGAISAVTACACIAANLIAFIAILEFVNQTLAWFGRRVGMVEPVLSFELICSYVLWPIAFMMGAVVDDCRKVAELVGVKIFINEFVAYTELSKIIENTNVFNDYTSTGGNWTRVNYDDILLIGTNTTLVGGIMADRSIVISTYALCGFANISSIGTMIGSISAMIPERRSEVARIATRAMLVGNVVSFMNACTAGLLYQNEGG